MLVFIVLVAMITSVISDEDGQVPFQPPTIPTGDSVYFAETFNDEDQFSHRYACRHCCGNCSSVAEQLVVITSCLGFNSQHFFRVFPSL